MESLSFLLLTAMRKALLAGAMAVGLSSTALCTRLEVKAIWADQTRQFGNVTLHNDTDRPVQGTLTLQNHERIKISLGPNQTFQTSFWSEPGQPPTASFQSGNKKVLASGGSVAGQKGNRAVSFSGGKREAAFILEGYRFSNSMGQIDPLVPTIPPTDVPVTASMLHFLGPIGLGSGTKDLSDAQVGALQNFLVGGGAIVMFADAKDSALQDRRWFKWFDKSHPDWTRSTKNAFWLHWRPVGLGSLLIVCRALDAKGLQKHRDTRRTLRLLFERFSASTTAKLPQFDVNDFPQPRPVKSDFDVMNAAPPELSRYMLILGGFVFLGIPGTFYVLGRLKRRELAWLVLPASAILTAFLISRQTANLSGFPVTEFEETTIAFVGGSETQPYASKVRLFFPEVGRHEVELKSVERVQPDAPPWKQATYDLHGNGPRLASYGYSSGANNFLAILQWGTTQALEGLSCQVQRTPSGKFLTIYNPGGLKFGAIYVHDRDYLYQVSAPPSSKKMRIHLSQYGAEPVEPSYGERLGDRATIRLEVLGIRVASQQGKPSKVSSVIATTMVMEGPR